MNYLIDMDGVIADFDSTMITEILRTTRARLKQEYSGYDMTKWFEDPFEEVGYAFKCTLDTSSFWEHMPVIPESVRTLNSLPNTNNIYVCTKPSFSPDCLYGKQMWINSILPKYKDKIIYIKNKEMLANSNTILIDDCPNNVEKFIKAGGNAYLFKKFYNENELRFSRLEDLSILLG